MKKKKYHYLSTIRFATLIALSFLGFSGLGEKSILKEVISQDLQSYISTHGETLDSSLFSPYASEYSRIVKIDTVKIVKQIFGRFPKPISDDVPKYISSYRYSCGNWTYFKSNCVGVYEVLKIKDEVTNTVYIAVLHNSPHTEEDLKWEGWHLSIFDEKLDLLSSYDLEKKSPFSFVEEEDMCYTDLRVVKGNLIAVITYTITGSGGFPEKGQSFEFSIEKNNLKLIKSIRIRDGALKSWIK